MRWLLCMRRAKTRRVMAHIGIIVLLRRGITQCRAQCGTLPSLPSLYDLQQAAHYPTYPPSGKAAAAVTRRAAAPSYECRTVLHAYMTDRELYTYYMGVSCCSRLESTERMVKDELLLLSFDWKLQCFYACP